MQRTVSSQRISSYFYKAIMISSKFEVVEETLKIITSLVLLMLLATCHSTPEVLGHIDCPNGCLCSSTNDKGKMGVHINCQSQQLEKIPSFKSVRSFVLQSLNLRNNSFGSENMTSEAFRDLEIYELDISDNRFNQISRDVFVFLKNSLRVLVCDNLALDLNNLDFLSGLSSLRKLSLRGNVQEHTITLRQFPGLGIVSLDMSENKIIQIGTEALLGVREKLEVLLLDETSVGFQNLSFLSNFTNLRRLSFQNNSQTDIALYGNVFKSLNLEKLASLSIGNCGLMHLNIDAFNGLEHIEKLDLSFNEFKSIPSPALSNLSKLRNLDLSYNLGITYILDKAFYSLKSIKVINMTGTGVDLIHSGAFMGTEDSLEVLLLSRCSLPEKSSFLVDAFTRLTSLTHLDLSFNKLVHIYNETFIYMTSLVELNLSGNIINFTDTMFSGLEFSLKVLKIRDMKLERFPGKSLSILESLNTLDATGNNITYLNTGDFTGLKAGDIILAKNNINQINPDAMRFLSGLNVLDLNDNNMTSFDFASKLHKCFVQNLWMSQNPVYCECSTVSVIRTTVCRKVIGHCVNLNNTSLTQLADISNVLGCNGCKCLDSLVLYIITSIVTLAFIYL